MNKEKKKKLIKRLEALSGLAFEIRQIKRRIEENPDGKENENLCRIEKEYNMLVEAIDRIEKPRLREILRMRYIDNSTWKAIAYEFFGHESDFTASLDRYLRRCYDSRNSALVELDKNLN